MRGFLNFLESNYEHKVKETGSPGVARLGV